MPINNLNWTQEWFKWTERQRGERVEENVEGSWVSWDQFSSISAIFVPLRRIAVSSTEFMLCQILEFLLSFKTFNHMNPFQLNSLTVRNIIFFFVFFFRKECQNFLIGWQLCGNWAQMNPRYQNENLMEIRASCRDCEREKCGIKSICWCLFEKHLRRHKELSLTTQQTWSKDVEVAQVHHSQLK